VKGKWELCCKAFLVRTRKKEVLPLFWPQEKGGERRRKTPGGREGGNGVTVGFLSPYRGGEARCFCDEKHKRKEGGCRGKSGNAASWYALAAGKKEEVTAHVRGKRGRGEVLLQTFICSLSLEKGPPVHERKRVDVQPIGIVRPR